MDTQLPCSDLLETCLERKDKWPKECLARANHLLAHVLRRLGSPPLNRPHDLEREASQLRDGLGNMDELLRPAEPHPALDSQVEYDLLVSFEAGRSTIGQYRVESVPVDTA